MGNVGLAVTVIAAVLLYPAAPAGTEKVSSGTQDFHRPTSLGVLCCDFCRSTGSGDGCYLVCPQGDGTRFDDICYAAIISIVVINDFGPVPGILPEGIWLVGATGGLTLCGNNGAINADSATSYYPPVGYTTISGAMKAGGCDLGLNVVAEGVIIGCPALLFAYPTKSPDINRDLIVDIIDLALFAPVYLGTQPYSQCMDYDCNGDVSLRDFALFGVHYLHRCQ